MRNREGDDFRARMAQSNEGRLAMLTRAGDILASQRRGVVEETVSRGTSGVQVGRLTSLLVLAMALTAAAVRPEIAHADQTGPNVTSSENPFIPEVGGEYQIIIDESVFNNPKADELRRLLRLGYFEIGDCANIQEVISTKSIEDPNSTLNGGTEPVEYRHVFRRCDIPAAVIPTQAPIPVTPSCVNLEVALGTASGNGAKSNSYTATTNVRVSGDAKFNGHFEANNSGADALVTEVTASSAAPVLIETGDEAGAWGLDVSRFCDPRDSAAQLQQIFGNNTSHGQTTFVAHYPGIDQNGVWVGPGTPATSPAVGTAVANSGIVENNFTGSANWTVSSSDLANGRFTIISGDGTLQDAQGNKFNIINGNPRIGTMVVFSGPGSESLPNGGHVWTGVPKSALRDSVESINNQITQTGCGGSCDGANTYLWDGGDTNILTPDMLAQLMR